MLKFLGAVTRTNFPSAASDSPDYKAISSSWAGKRSVLPLAAVDKVFPLAVATMFAHRPLVRRRQRTMAPRHGFPFSTL